MNAAASSKREKIRAILLVDSNISDSKIAEDLHCSRMMVASERVRAIKDGVILAGRKTYFYQKVREELHENHRRANSEIAKIVGCSSSHVARIREELVKAGAIGKWVGSIMKNKGEGAIEGVIAASLRADYQRSNRSVGYELNCSGTHVQRVRIKMEKAGEIPVWRAKNGNQPLITIVTSELTRDPRRTNHTISVATGYNESGVQDIRRKLEGNGVIERWRGTTRDGPPQDTYVIQGKQTGLFKVGKTGHIEKRLKELQCGSPDILDVIHILSGEKWEGVLHGRLNSHHSHGEWFENTEVTRDIITEVVNEALSESDDADYPL